MKRIPGSLFSMTSTGVLLIAFIISIAWATIIEKNYGTATARIYVYNARWFEILLLITALQLSGSMIYNRLLQKRKWGAFLFHMAFVVILAGAAVTRFTGFEGTLHIREGEENNRLLTDATYMKVSLRKGNETYEEVKEVRFSPYTPGRFKKTYHFAGSRITLESLQFMTSASETVVEEPFGEPILSMLAISRDSGRFDFILRENQSIMIGGYSFGFMNPEEPVNIRIRKTGGQLFLESSDTLVQASMDSQVRDKLVPGGSFPFREKVVYQAEGLSFVLRKYFPGGKVQLVHDPSQTGLQVKDALNARITGEGGTRDLVVYGKAGEEGRWYKTAFGDLEIAISYGSVVHELPFTLQLNDFQIERYPGSESPSSFASEVILIDEAEKVRKPYRIFMNNILRYKGYRFYQSSFDHDEKGTVLSVNHDRAGTLITYIGYCLLVAGMALTLFNRRSRFYDLLKSSARLASKRKKLFISLLCGLVFAGTLTASPGDVPAVAADHARNFGRLLVQNSDGRIEPVNTLASEILRKVARKGSFEGLDPVQVILEMMGEPEKWREKPVIRVSDSGVAGTLGISGNYASFNDFFTSGEEGVYKLRDHVENAYDRKPAQRSKLDKEVINADERINIVYKLMTGGFLTIFPVPGDQTNKWLSPGAADTCRVPGVSGFSKQALNSYFTALYNGKQTGNYQEADKALTVLKENQKKFGAEIIPPEIKTSLEVFYVNNNIFSTLAKVYVVLGVFLLFLQFYALLTTAAMPAYLQKAGFSLVLLLFLVHSAGLGIRWYISGHAPWSNGYETLIYISWATCLAGLLLSGRSPITLAVTTLLSSISLFVAGMSWMSPELTNLVPVLKSYWLVIHVAVITASYGFFAMAALAGILNMILLIARAATGSPRVSFTIRELEVIIQIAFIAGLFMLTAGSFLGGVWANESWGRYWGWDPKETWALVTILVYAFIVHMHRIPGFRGAYAVSLASLTGFASVLMTFFGVNYYLSGLHSYAGGEVAPLPRGVYVAVVLVTLLAVAAYAADRKERKSAIDSREGKIHLSAKDDLSEN